MTARILYHVAVNRQTRCWEWLGTVQSESGYARIRVDGKTAYAHRVSYEAFVGPIQAGLQIDHLCRNRACVNPEHLEPVTAVVNIRRSETPGAIARRRTHCLRGHEYATHGVMRTGRRRCRICQTEYIRAYRRRLRAELEQGLAHQGRVA